MSEVNVVQRPVQQSPQQKILPSDQQLMLLRRLNRHQILRHQDRLQILRRGRRLVPRLQIYTRLRFKK